MEISHKTGRLASCWEGPAIFLLFLLLPLMLFWSVTMGDRTILPVDNLFAWEPFRAHAAEHGVAPPHNPLLSDLILQNYAWQRHIRESVEQGSLPLWNPYLFSGTPFLSKGQHMALYPPSMVLHAFPHWKAYGVFIVVHLGLSGFFAFCLARALGLERFPAIISGLCYGLSGFMLAGGVFPMIIATAAWFPLILAAIVKLTSWPGGASVLPVRWIGVGAVALGMQALAGHAEMLYYSLLVCGFLGVWRLVSARKRGQPGAQLRAVILLGVIGLLLGAIQLVPLYEVLSGSFRSGYASLSEVRDWAYPLTQSIAFLVPNFFGNPSHLEYAHVFTGETVRAQGPVFWGAKNFVEGAIYIGILPLLLAAISRAGHWRDWRMQIKAERVESPVVFVVLLVFSLAFAFGTPLYALVYYLPGLEQVHSPFRWMLVATLSLAILAGYGVRRISRDAEENSPVSNAGLTLIAHDGSLTSRIARMTLWIGCGLLGLLLISRVFYPSMAPVFDIVFRFMERAGQVFPDAQHFYSYQFPWLLQLAILTILSAVVLGLSRSSVRLPRSIGGLPLWKVLLLLLVAVDLLNFARGLFPENDPELLAYRPPVVEFLAKDDSHWRMTTFDPDDRKTLNPNMGWLFGFEDIRGYDSIIGADYVSFMQGIDDQDQLSYNRIAPLRSRASLNSPLLDVLNVKYVLTEFDVNSHKWRRVYQDGAVRVYRNTEVLPRAFVLSADATVLAEDPVQALRHYDPRFHVIVEPERIRGDDLPGRTVAGTHRAAAVRHHGNDRVKVEVQVEQRSWLVLADRYDRGWQAYGTNMDEPGQRRELKVHPVNGVLRGVLLEPGAWKVSFEYRPAGLLLGIALSVLGGIGLLILAGWSVSGWRRKRLHARNAGFAHE